MEDDEGGGVGAVSTVVGLIENRAKERRWRTTREEVLELRALW
ncbi:hypothetical protein IHE45_20G019100 [Dioscorea alata]|uniref:Uncharacterized protein n=1 Tax=Dioscorea alata TaxID=55571 RepID=A0ACB7TQR2_DIOAL|nr:hypothetical protein IHE45_20G019100 [Dioscorea alata]